MATKSRPLINDDLLHEVQESARIQNRKPQDIVSEAVRKYWMSAPG